LYTIGLIVFFLNIVLFLGLSACMLVRFTLYPTHTKNSLIHPQESFFFSSFWLSISVIISGIQLYGVTLGPGYPWLIDTIYVLYWIYAGCSLVNSIALYWLLISSSLVRPVPFLSSYFLVGYSAMLTGTVSSLIAAHQPPGRATVVIISGCAYQGYGMLISFVCITYFIRDLMDNGLPPPPLRPAMFIPVGSCSYTIVAFIGQANAIPVYGYFAAHPSAKDVLQVLSLFLGIFLWIFTLWLFAIAVLGNLAIAGKMPFSLAWWAFIFPNVGFNVATTMIGRELASEGILWVGSLMTILLVVIWCTTAVGCARAVWLGQIMWPGRDEDKGR
jgi:tellurite resistance protein TehA-like permease